MTSSYFPKIAPFLSASLLVFALFLAAACSSERPDPDLEATSVPAPIATPTPAVSSGATASPEATATPVPTPDTPEPTPEPPPPTGPIAPELVGTQEWVNSDPLTIEGLRGKVVLVDFWTYTCVNCIRTLPYLKVWHSKYADDGLVILGVHTPEFRFEHDIDNVRQAVDDYSLTYPIVQDNNFETWDAFDNRYWPAKYLIDQNGVIRYQHYGEGAYDETEAMIRLLLEETGVNVSAITPLLAPNQDLDFAFKNSIGAEITAELYGGYERSCSLYQPLLQQLYCRPGLLQVKRPDCRVHR